MTTASSVAKETRTLAIQAVVETHRGLGIAERELKLGQFTAARQTIRQATAMCELLDTLVPQIGRERILAGDPAVIEKQLDALPVGAVVQSSPEARADRECAVFVAAESFGWRTWEGSGVTGSFATSYLARYCAPLTVIA